MNFREIKIKPVSNGIKVKIGCMELVYAKHDFKQAFKDLKKYIEHPEDAEKEIRKRWGIPEDVPTTYTMMGPSIISDGTFYRYDRGQDG